MDSGGDFLAGYAPGTLPNILKPGQAKLVKAGTDIVLQMHYTSNGKAGTDISRIGIVFSNSESQPERVLTLAAGNVNLSIPAGDSNYEVVAKLTSSRTAIPHYSTCCRICTSAVRAFGYKATYPTGESEILL